METHVKKYKLHEKLAAAIPDNEGNTFLQKNTVPYNFTLCNQGTEDLVINYPGIVFDVQEVVEITTDTVTPIQTKNAVTQTDPSRRF